MNLINSIITKNKELVEQFVKEKKMLISLPMGTLHYGFQLMAVLVDLKIKMKQGLIMI